MKITLNKTPGESYWNSFLDLLSNEVVELLQSDKTVKSAAKDRFRQFVCFINIETAI